MWVRRPQPHHCAAVGQALAEMHEAGRDFPLRRENALSLSGWPPLFEMSRARADEVEPGLADFVDRELAALASAWPTGLPDGVIHADLFPDNVFFLKGKLSGLIDFYFACNDFLVYDLAVCLNAWCFEPDCAFNVTKGRAMIQAYANVRRLEAAELEALPILARGAALRFLLTRLHDWLTVPAGALVTPKDPREYLRKLRFHLKVTNAADYGVAA
jgi:homoserine kinase type II